MMKFMLQVQAAMESLETLTHGNHRDHNYHRCSSKTSEVSSLDDCESLDSCFIDPEEEFYSHDSTTPTPPTPSEDIWKKFELYPTPPLSPTHPEDLKATIEPLLNDEELDMLESDFLQDVTDILMNENDLPWMTRNCDFSEPVFRAPSPASPALIQDCMWSSFIAEERRKFFMKTEKKTQDKPKTPAISAMNTSSMMLPPLIPASEYGSSDCVDPSAVFPYPISETRLDLFSSGSNTPSDSDEEIDVVTVEKKHGHHHHKTVSRPHHRHQTTKQRRPPQIQQQAINITLLGKRGCPSNATVLTIPIKKLKAEANIEEVKEMLQKSSIVKTTFGRRSNSTGSSRNSSLPSSLPNSLPSSLPSSRPSSDSEDTEKRACHNVLERKRREDLRTSFLLLRDEVPELSSSERAAKVVILKKATDCVVKLRDLDDSLKMELEMERRKNLLLRSRLESLLAPRPF